MAITDNIANAMGARGFPGFLAKSVANSGNTKFRHSLPGYVLGGGIAGAVLGNTGPLGYFRGEIANAYNRATANGYKYKLVPYDDHTRRRFL